jgi:hypothetical protein
MPLCLAKSFSNFLIISRIAQIFEGLRMIVNFRLERLHEEIILLHTHITIISNKKLLKLAKLKFPIANYTEAARKATEPGLQCQIKRCHKRNAN